MKTLLIAGFAALLVAACSSGPQLKFPTGENRVPINVQPASASASDPTGMAEAAKESK